MDITALADTARETMQEFEGDEYIPQLFVEFDNRTMVWYVLPDFPGKPQTPTSVKQRYFEKIGALCREAHPHAHIKELCFVCKIWGVHRTHEQPRDFRFVSEAADRKEYLMFLHLHGTSGKQTMLKFEIKCRGKQTELGPLEQEESGMMYENSLFPAFRAGFQGVTR